GQVPEVVRRPCRDSQKASQKCWYPFEDAAKSSYVPCREVTGQNRRPRAIPAWGVQSAESSWDRELAGFLTRDGEGVEAQIHRWRDRLFHCQQRGASGRERYL